MDLSPRALSDWIDSLPIAHPELVARRILDATHEVNRLDTGDSERMRFVTSIGDVALPILRSLQLRLRDVAAPPSKKEMELAELSIALHQELALAHRSMLQCKPARKNIFAKSTQVDQYLHATRGLYHLCQSLKVHYFINVEPVDDIWDKLYGLYALLDEDGRKAELNRAIPDEDYRSVDDAFKTAVLLHLSDPRALRGDEVDYLSKLLPNASRHARLLPVDEANKYKLPRSYLLKVMRGGGSPTYYSPADCADCTRRKECLVLDVSPMAAYIRHRMSQPNARSQTRNNRVVNEHNVLAHLNKQLGVRHKRDYKRLSGEYTIYVLAGLQQCHHYLTNGYSPRTPPETLSATEVEPQISNAGIDYNVVLNLELVTFETRSTKTREMAAIVNNTDAPVLRRARCKTLNFSLGGYCLNAEKSSGLRLSVGEFMAMREKGYKRWLPACVSWLSTDGENLHFGIRLMAPHMRPGKAICHQNEETHAAECLLLFDKEDEEIPSRILMNPGCITAGAYVRVEFGKFIVDMQLEQELCRTQGFVEFSCQKINSNDLEPETVLSFQAPTADSSLTRENARFHDANESNGSSSNSIDSAKRPWKRLR